MPGSGNEDNDASLGSASPDGFQDLFERYYDAVFRQIVLLLGRDTAAAEDVAQETWWRIARSLKTFEGRSGFYAWACRIASNEVKRWWGKHKRLTAVGSEPASDPAEDPTDGRDQAELVHAVLLRIPEEFRQPLLLDLWEGYSQREISEALGLPEGTVKSRLFRARERFRELWDELNEQ